MYKVLTCIRKFCILEELGKCKEKLIEIRTSIAKDGGQMNRGGGGGEGALILHYYFWNTSLLLGRINKSYRPLDAQVGCDASVQDLESYVMDILWGCQTGGC